MRFAAGQVFTSYAVTCLKNFAAWVMASIAALIVCKSALSVLLTIDNEPGMRHMAIAICSDHLLAIFFAGIVWLMAAVIGQGQAIADENATFV